MTARRDLDNLVRAYLDEGPMELPNRSFDAVRNHIDHTRQRVVVGPWRMPIMNKLAPIGLGAAAVVAVLLLGSRLLGPPTGPGGPGASPSPTPVASLAVPPTAAGAESSRRDPRPRSLPVGPFLVQDVGAPADTPFITVTIPAPGWTSIPDYGGLTKGPDTAPPQSDLLLWAWPVGTAFDVYGDPCQWTSTRPDTPATTVAEIAAALAAQGSRDASDPVDVTVGPAGFTGKKITLHVPNDAVFEDCDDDTFASYGVAGQSTPNRTHQGPGQVDELWLLNVNQTIVFIDVMYRPDTPAALIDEMRTIALSAQFAW